MGEEIGVKEGSGWRKAIPEGRDRIQSRWLVGVVGVLLVLETVIGGCNRFTFSVGHRSRW